MVSSSPLGSVVIAMILSSLIAIGVASTDGARMGRQSGVGLGMHLPPRLANSTAPPARITAVVVLGEVRE